MKAEIVTQTRLIGTDEKSEKRNMLRKLTVPQTAAIGTVCVFDEIGKQYVLGARKLDNSVIESWIEFSDD